MRAKLVMILGMLALSACSSRDEADLYTGYVEVSSVSIAAPQSGWLVTVAVDRGAQIAADQPLFTLEATREAAALAGAEQRQAAAEASANDLTKGARDADIAPLLAQRVEAKAQADLARADEARYARLERQGYVSAAQMDALRAKRQAADATVASIDKSIEAQKLAARSDQLAAAKATAEALAADVAQARWSANDRVVTARLTGRVEERLREPGEFVQAGSSVLTVLPMGREFVRFYVPQSVVPRVKVGQIIKLSCDGCKAGLTARVRFIAHEAEFTPPVIYSVRERQKLVFMIEATPDNPDALRAGQPVDVRL